MILKLFIKIDFYVRLFLNDLVIQFLKCFFDFYLLIFITSVIIFD